MKASQGLYAGPVSRRLLLVLVVSPALALTLANVPMSGIDSAVDLLIMLMVGVVLGDPRSPPAR